MNTHQRIERILGYTGKDWSGCLSGPPEGPANLHDLLDQLDTLLGVDTRTLGALECNCLWHIGKVCSAVRQLGARVTMLEEAVARDKLEQEIERNKEVYAYG